MLAPLQAIALALTGLAVPLAVLSPRPFLFLAEGLAALCALDRTRFLVLHGRAVGQPLPGAPLDLDGRDQMAWLLAHPATSSTSRRPTGSTAASRPCSPS